MSLASTLKIEFASGIPVYRQIVNFVSSEIGKGGLRAGDRLPTIRELTECLGVNPNTIAKAYRELDLRGVITSRRGDGSFVAASPVTQERFTAQQKKAKLDELLGRMIAEAKGFGITENELVKHITERTNDDE
jgi:GntR family transcriptional regulator